MIKAVVAFQVFCQFYQNSNFVFGIDLLKLLNNT